MDSLPTKILIAAALLVFVVGALFFQKDRQSAIPLDSSAQVGSSRQAQIVDEIKSNGAARTLENFLMAYNDCAYGDFSNIMNLFPYMTSEFKQAQGKRIEELEEEAVENKRYETVKPEMKEIEMISYDSATGKLVLKITLERSIYGGQKISDEGDGVILVDEQGRKYDGKIEDLLKKKETITYLITGIKEGDRWKVSDLQESK